jgi:hypothetical protein
MALGPAVSAGTLPPWHCDPAHAPKSQLGTTCRTSHAATSCILFCGVRMDIGHCLAGTCVRGLLGAHPPHNVRSGLVFPPAFCLASTGTPWCTTKLGELSTTLPPPPLPLPLSPPPLTKPLALTLADTESD